jgi:hypothetical protein
MTQSLTTLNNLPNNTILDTDFIRDCPDEIMNALLEVGNVNTPHQFLELYLGMSLTTFLTEMTE